MQPIRRLTLAALVPLLFVAVAGRATTYQSMFDGDLHDQSAVVARVEVLTVSPAPAFGAPSTDYIVLVERLLKGRVSGTTVVVRVIGGTRPDGLGLEIHGAPRFTEGDRALLFLSPRSDGTYGIQQLMLGAFMEVDRGAEHRSAVRRLEGVRLVGDETLEEQATLRDWDRFERWLADRSEGRFREPDYFVDVSRAPGSVFLPNFLEANGEPIRFFEFDEGGKVIWKVGRGLSGAKKAFKKATKAWNNEPDTIVNLVRRGRTSSRNGFARSDGLNAIIFNDPNDEVEGTYSCQRGGVIALGGSWFLRSPVMIQKIPKGIGRGKANVAIEADIITNNGTACLLSDAKAAEQIFGHELGHTLGLGHSCDSNCRNSEQDALMYAFFHRDGRGAELRSWDRNWIDKLY